MVVALAVLPKNIYGTYNTLKG